MPRKNDESDRGNDCLASKSRVVTAADGNSECAKKTIQQTNREK